MYHLKEFCALIFSGVSLYDGLNTKIGTVAVYGKENLVYTLFKQDHDSSFSKTESMLKAGLRIKYRYLIHSKEKLFSTVCLNKNDGVIGLEEFLYERGFVASDYRNQKKASDFYFQLSAPDSQMEGEKNDPSIEISRFGRTLASAVSMSQVRLTGDFSCASSKGNKAYHVQHMDSPLDLGLMKLIHISKLSKPPKALVYMNGHLRILTGTKESITDFNNMIWEIYPKLDRTEDYGLMNRRTLDDFLASNSYRIQNKFKNPKGDHVLLGCLNS